jgi:hypothetical protein
MKTSFHPMNGVLCVSWTPEDKATGSSQIRMTKVKVVGEITLNIVILIV